MAERLSRLDCDGSNEIRLRISCENEVIEAVNPYSNMKETTWSKLRELWAIRRRCQEIKPQQRRNRLAEKAVRDRWEQPIHLADLIPRGNVRAGGFSKPGSIKTPISGGAGEMGPGKTL